MAELTPSSNPMRIDRKLFATRLKAFKAAPVQTTAHTFGFGMKVLENIESRTHPTVLSFKNVGEILIPISKEDLQRLKAVSQPIRNGLWQMDLKSFALDNENPHVAKYLDITIPMMADLTLRNLQLSREMLEGFTVQPYKLTITEPGTGVVVRQPTNNAPGAFASMIVQFPIQGGHQGGCIKIIRGNLMRTFENALESSLLFHYTAFMSNCTFQMAELNSGSTVTITFHLVCSNSSSLISSPTHLKDVASMLLQLSPKGPDRLLAIPLDNNEISFSSLSPSNRHLFELFKTMNFIHVQLAIVCHFRAGRANQPKGCPCCVKRKCPCEDVVMFQICQEKISTIRWIDASDKDMEFENLNIDTKTEIVGDEPVFFDKPTHETTDQQTGLLQQYFHRPMLVIWHKERSMQLDCFHRFDILLKNLELRAQSTDEREEILRSLDEIVKFCKEFPEIAWKKDSASCQVLKLCIRLKSNEAAVELLEILAVKQGIRNESMADVLAEVVASIGWDLCSAPISKFVCISRAQEQMRYYVRLTSALLNAGCHNAAVVIANQIYTFLSMGNFITLLEISVVALCVDLMMILDESPLTEHPRRLANLSVHTKEKLSSFMPILKLLALVQHALDARPAERIPDTAVAWYYDVCLYLSRLVIPYNTQPDAVLSALKLIVSLGDSTIIESFINHISSEVYQANGVLPSLIAAEDLWNFAQVSSENKKVVGSLVDKRIQWLVSIPKPIATWQVPNASVIGHPIVENFMRSNERCMTYRNFNNIGHARNWRRKHSHELCHYAELDVGGAGGGAYCVIQKKHQRYVGDDAKRAVCYKELMELIERRLTRLGDALYSVVKDQNTDEISSVEVVQQLTTTPLPVQSTPVVAVAVAPMVSNPAVLNRGGTRTVSVLSNAQQPAKKTATKIEKAAVNRTPSTLKVVPVSIPTVGKAAEKKIILRKTRPANVLAVRQVNQQPCTSSQTPKTPVDDKSSIHFQTLLPSNVPSPKTTPRRVGIAKRPLNMASVSQSSSSNPSLTLQNPAVNVKEESAPSPLKRAKLEMA